MIRSRKDILFIMLTTDASKFPMRSVLSQGKIGKDKSIAYASRSLSDTEKTYDS